MLLFYTYLQAAQEANLHQARQEARTAIANHQKLIIFTDKDDKPILILPEDTEHIFNLISELVESPEEDLPLQLTQALELPQDAQGWVIHLGGEEAPDLSKITPYSENLKTLFKDLREAQKNNDGAEFFKTLESFLKEGHDHTPWKMEERIQFFSLFQFLSLQFKDQDLKKIAERFFTFKLSKMNGEELYALQYAHLNGSHVTVDNLKTLKNWIEAHYNSPRFTVKIEETLNDENLVELNQFLDQNIVGINRETQEVVYKVKVEINGKFATRGMDLLNQMIADQKIVSLKLLRGKNQYGIEEGIKIETARVLLGGLKKEAEKGHNTFKHLTLTVDLDDQNLIELNHLLEEFTPETILLGIGGNFRVRGLTLINDMLRLQKITSLDLWGNQMGDAGAQAIAAALKVNTTLTSLGLWGSQMGDAGAQAIADALKINTTLTSLYLSNNQMRDEGAKALADALKVNTTLASLNLGYSHIEDAGAQVLAEALKANKTLTSLDLNHNQIGEAGAQALAEALIVNTTLASLDLNHNQIGDAGGQVLADALEVNTTLTSLDLHHNQIGAAGGQALAEALKVNTTLTSLKLVWNQIQDAGGQVLAEALKVNTTLTELNLSGNRIGDAGAQAIAGALTVNTTLTSLCLGGNYIGAEGAQALAEALKVNTTLTSLNLSHHNQIGDAGAQALAEALTVNTTLTSLDLLGNQIGVEGKAALRAAQEEASRAGRALIIRGIN